MMLANTAPPLSDTMRTTVSGVSPVSCTSEKVLSNTTTTSEPGSPEILVELDRERAAALGVSAEDVGAAMRTKIRGEVVGEFQNLGPDQRIESEIGGFKVTLDPTSLDSQATQQAREALRTALAALDARDGHATS